MTRLLVLMVVVLGPASAAAKDAFDIARFVPPARWQRSPAPGLLTLQAPPGRGSSAQIFLFPSEPSRGAPEENLQAAWRKLVATPLGGLGPGQTSTETTPDGWTAVTGVAPYTKQGASWRLCILGGTGDICDRRDP